MSVAIQVIHDAAKDGVSLSRLAEMADTVPSFAERIRRDCARIKDIKTIDTTERAVSLVGTRTVCNIAFAAIIDAFVGESRARDILLEQGLRRAIACRTIAENLHETRLERFYSAALFLDIGFVIHGGQLVGLLETTAGARDQLLGAVVGRSHVEAGVEFLGTYGAPIATIQAVKHHHAEAPSSQGQAAAAWLAERFAAASESYNERRVRQAAVEAAARLELPSSTALACLAELETLVAKAVKPLLLSEEHSLAARLSGNHHEQAFIPAMSAFQRTVDALDQVLQENAKLRRCLEEQAGMNLETQLPNRGGLLTVLERDLARQFRDKSALSLMLFQVTGADVFPREERLGELVLDIKNVLEKTARGSDFVAYLGDGKFAMILTGAAGEPAQIAAKRLKMAIQREAFKAHPLAWELGVKFGTVDVLRDAQRETAAGMLARAKVKLATTT